MIDLRSFSNLWYWIALAVFWSAASQRVLGVPFEMVGRARHGDAQQAKDLQDVARVQVKRTLYVYETSGTFLIALTFFVLTALALLGFVYAVEFAQALFLILFPMSFVGLLNLSAARKINASPADPEALCRRLTLTRLWIQLVGIVSIFVTALWGMYQNLALGVFG